MKQLPEVPGVNDLAIVVRLWINRQAAKRDDSVEEVLRDLWDCEPSLVADLKPLLECADFYEGLQ